MKHRFSVKRIRLSEVYGVVCKVWEIGVKNQYLKAVCVCVSVCVFTHVSAPWHDDYGGQKINYRSWFSSFSSKSGEPNSGLMTRDFAARATSLIPSGSLWRTLLGSSLCPAILPPSLGNSFVPNVCVTHCVPETWAAVVNSAPPGLNG